jgi:putative nucleotidyltransferase with HDIG domain
MITRQKALEIVEANTENKNLVKHCLCVEAAMRGLAKYFNEDEEMWGLIGLLHDADWEKNRETPHNHTRDTVKWLKEEGLEEDTVIRTILSHNHELNGEEGPKTNLEWSLYTCDELTGIIVTTTLVMPSKKLADVTVESILKKFNSKSFAAAVDRSQIKLCEEKLGIKLEDFIQIILSSMQTIALRLGL